MNPPAPTPRRTRRQHLVPGPRRQDIAYRETNCRQTPRHLPQNILVENPPLPVGLTLRMSRAPRRQDRTRPSGAPAPFACYTAPQMSPRQIETRAMAPAIRTTPKAARHQRNRDDARTFTVAQPLGATTGDGLASRGGSMQEPTVSNNARARAATRTPAMATNSTPT